MGRSVPIELLVLDMVVSGGGSSHALLTDDNRFVTIKWNALCARFVLYSGIIQSGDENAAHRQYLVSHLLLCL